jgi:hypothetical protein
MHVGVLAARKALRNDLKNRLISRVDDGVMEDMMVATMLDPR